MGEICLYFRWFNFLCPQTFAETIQETSTFIKVLFQKVKGSNNRGRSAIRLLRLHYRLFSIRQDFIHKLSTDLAKTKQVLCVESLNTKGMMQNQHLLKSISDVAWGEFVRQLEYKCAWGIEVAWSRPLSSFPQTRMCSCYGHINLPLLLSQRIFRCEECLMECDRDVNAAKNLERWVLSTVSSTGIDVSGEVVPQGSSLKQEENTVYPTGIGVSFLEG